MVLRYILQGFCNLPLKFMLRLRTKRHHEKAFHFLSDLVCGTLSLGFGLGHKDEIYFLSPKLLNMNYVILKEQDPKLKNSCTDQWP